MNGDVVVDNDAGDDCKNPTEKNQSINDNSCPSFTGAYFLMEQNNTVEIFVVVVTLRIGKCLG
jgi:hypothetical protein